MHMRRGGNLKKGKSFIFSAFNGRVFPTYEQGTHMFILQWTPQSVSLVR